MLRKNFPRRKAARREVALINLRDQRRMRQSERERQHAHRTRLQRKKHLRHEEEELLEELNTTIAWLDRQLDQQTKEILILESRISHLAG